METKGGLLKMSLISIIIPCYNVESYITKCLDSLLTNNKSFIEVLLINDGSTDSTKSICENYARIYENIRVISQKNTGVGIARNKGLEVAKGDYIWFIDPDDYVTDRAIDIIKEELDNNDANVVMFDYFNLVDDDLEEKKLKIYQNFDRDEFGKVIVDLYSTEMMYTLWNKIYNKNFLIENKIKFKKIPMGQDCIFNLDVFEKVKKVKSVSKKIYIYRSDRTESSTNKYRKNRYLLQIEELKKIVRLFNFYGLPKRKIDDFQRDRLKKILLGSIINIANSNMEYEIKYYLFENLNNEFIFKKTLHSYKITFFLVRKKDYKILLLYCQHIRPYLKKTKYKIDHLIYKYKYSSEC